MGCWPLDPPRQGIWRLVGGRVGDEKQIYASSFFTHRFFLHIAMAWETFEQIGGPGGAGWGWGSPYPEKCPEARDWFELRKIMGDPAFHLYSYLFMFIHGAPDGDNGADGVLSTSNEVMDTNQSLLESSAIAIGAGCRFVGCVWLLCCDGCWGCQCPRTCT